MNKIVSFRDLGVQGELVTELEIAFRNKPLPATNAQERWRYANGSA